MKKITVVFFAIAFFAITVTYAQPKKRETAKRWEQTNKLVKPIEAYAKTIEDFIKKEGKPHLIIADASNPNKDKNPIWKNFASKDALEKAREKRETYTIAYLWKKNNKIVAANFTYFSQSGDWVQYVYYVFNRDGSLAKVNRELRTFMGDIIINRIHIYNRKGKLIKETKNFRDLATGKLIKAPKSFQDIDVEIYKKVGDFPFILLLPKNKRPNKCD